MIQQVLRADGIAQGPEPEIYEENIEAFELFCGAKTQWKIISSGFGAHYQGLDYTALQSLFWFQNIKKKHRAKLFEAIQLIEQGALSVLNKK